MTFGNQFTFSDWREIFESGFHAKPILFVDMMPIDNFKHMRRHVLSREGRGDGRFKRLDLVGDLSLINDATYCQGLENK